MTRKKSNTLRFAGAIIIAGLTSANAPRPLSLTVGAGISGASIAQPYVTCNYFGSASGGTEPYTYEWLVDNQPAGDGSTILPWTNSGSSYEVRLNVSDANNVAGSTALSVTVDPNAPDHCLDQ